MSLTNTDSGCIFPGRESCFAVHSKSSCSRHHLSEFPQTSFWFHAFGGCIIYKHHYLELSTKIKYIFHLIFH